VKARGFAQFMLKPPLFQLCGGLLDNCHWMVCEAFYFTKIMLQVARNFSQIACRKKRFAASLQLYV